MSADADRCWFCPDGEAAVTLDLWREQSGTSLASACEPCAERLELIASGEESGCGVCGGSLGSRSHRISGPHGGHEWSLDLCMACVQTAEGPGAVFGESGGPSLARER